MGIGDEIMATAQARRMQKSDPRKVAILGKNGHPRWHVIWDGNPRLAKPEEVGAGLPVQLLDNRSGKRPYLDYARFTTTTWAYADWSVNTDGPGEIYLNDAERAFGKHTGGAIILEPHIRRTPTSNKDWGWEKWVILSRLLRDLPLVQLGPIGTTILPGVRQVSTPTMRQACGAISGARAVITTEGGTHHAAAALGIPAVVIFGGYISPATTGYSTHSNIWNPHPEYPKGCGSRTSCSHCQAAMDVIRPEQVAKALRELLETREAA